MDEVLACSKSMTGGTVVDVLVVVKSFINSEGAGVSGLEILISSAMAES